VKNKKIIKLKITYKPLWFAYDSNKIAFTAQLHKKKQKFKILRDLKEEKSFYLKKADFRMKEKRTYRGR